MVNTRQKGYRKELQVQKLLEAEGYQVVRPNYNRYGYTDFYNLWDLIAVGPKDVRFVQVKSRKSQTYGKKLQPHRDFVCPPCVKKECWVMIDRQKEPLIIEL